MVNVTMSREKFEVLMKNGSINLRNLFMGRQITEMEYKKQIKSYRTLKFLHEHNLVKFEGQEN